LIVPQIGEVPTLQQMGPFFVRKKGQVGSSHYRFGEIVRNKVYAQRQSVEQQRVSVANIDIVQIAGGP
jgi:hypothetical protein